MELSKDLVINTITLVLEYSQFSDDSETQVGCIIITEDNIYLFGSNKFIEFNEADLPTTRPAKYEYILHAEESIILRAAKFGYRLSGAIAFITLSPCPRCIRLLYQSGISTIIFDEKYRDFNLIDKMKDLDYNIEDIYGFSKLTIFPKREI